MNVQVKVHGVDGETTVSINSTNHRSAAAALDFLRNQDHEGSALDVVITTGDDPEEAYELLRRAQDVQEHFHKARNS